MYSARIVAEPKAVITLFFAWDLAVVGETPICNECKASRRGGRIMHEDGHVQHFAWLIIGDAEAVKR